MPKEKILERRIQRELEKIEAITEARYTTRAQLMESITFPQNSPNLICIPSNEKGIGFLKTEYDGRFLTGVITRNEFDNVIEKASNMMGNVYSEKRKLDSQGVPMYYKISLLLSLVIAFVFLWMAYYLPEKNVAYKTISFVLLACSVIIV